MKNMLWVLIRSTLAGTSMSTTACFYGEMRKNIPELSPDTPDYLFVCVEVLRPSQPIGVMSSAVSLPNHTFTGQA